MLFHLVKFELRLGHRVYSEHYMLPLLTSCILLVSNAKELGSSLFSVLGLTSGSYYSYPPDHISRDFIVLFPVEGLHGVSPNEWE